MPDPTHAGNHATNATASDPRAAAAHADTANVLARIGVRKMNGSVPPSRSSRNAAVPRIRRAIDNVAAGTVATISLKTTSPSGSPAVETQAATPATDASAVAPRRRLPRSMRPSR